MQELNGHLALWVTKGSHALSVYCCATWSGSKHVQFAFGSVMASWHPTITNVYKYSSFIFVLFLFFDLIGYRRTKQYQCRYFSISSYRERFCSAILHLARNLRLNILYNLNTSAEVSHFVQIFSWEITAFSKTTLLMYFFGGSHFSQSFIVSTALQFCSLTSFYAAQLFGVPVITNTCPLPFKYT